MRPVSAAILSVLIGTGAAAQEAPLSAIDWLDDMMEVPIAQPVERPSEPAVAKTAASPHVDVLPLDGTSADAVGLLPTSKTGLPVTLWSASQTRALVAELARLPDEPLPALQALYYTLLLAEADAPADAGADAAFLRARVDALAGFGAVEPAKALLERAGPETPELFDPWLDLSLLTGTEEAPCDALHATPALSERYAARIFCTAQSGDWPTAALIYETSEGLQALSPAEKTLLALFLDPETIEIEEPPVPPKTITPLTYRLFEAAGAPLPTRNLPRAFATLDLRNTAGWRAGLEAAERLARTGALPANRLLGMYTERDPAASGGVWDRVAAIQKLERALDGDAPEKIATALLPVWRDLGGPGLKVAFADLFAAALRDRDLPAPARDLAFRINLLSDDYETAGEMLPSPDPAQEFLIGLAAGAPETGLAETDEEAAVARAFAPASPVPTEKFARLLRVGKLGEAILAAAGQLDRSRSGNPADLTDALVTLRALGLENTARRAALQMLILEGA